MTTLAEKLEAAEKAVKAGGCPACSCMRTKPYELNGRKLLTVKTCLACKAVYGELYLGDSYAVVEPYWDKETEPVETRYFDFTCLGSAGVTRRHGWYNPATKRITQVG